MSCKSHRLDWFLRLWKRKPPFLSTSKIKKATITYKMKHQLSVTVEQLTMLISGLQHAKREYERHATKSAAEGHEEVAQMYTMLAQRAQELIKLLSE